MVLGGFAAAKLRRDGQPFGNGRNSFLFDLNRDALVPFRPRVDDACHLFATAQCFAFGRRDFVLDGNFDDCESTIENSYGVWFEQESEDAKRFWGDRISSQRMSSRYGDSSRSANTPTE
jgi:hypothetical protein